MKSQTRSLQTLLIKSVEDTIMAWPATDSFIVAQLLLASGGRVRRADAPTSVLTFNWTWHQCAPAVYSRICFYLKEQAQA